MRPSKNNEEIEIYNESNQNNKIRLLSRTTDINNTKNINSVMSNYENNQQSSNQNYDDSNLKKSLKFNENHSIQSVRYSNLIQETYRDNRNKL